MGPTGRGLHHFIENLQLAIGSTHLDSRERTAQRLLMLEGALPPYETQPRALLLRAILVRELLRFARSCGAGLIASDLVGLLDPASDDDLRRAYRATILPLVSVLRDDSASVPAPRYSDPRVYVALAKVKEGATIPGTLKLDDVARSCNLSKWHLARLLKRFTGLRFKEHVRAVRMEAARDLLLTSDLTMKEIAGQTGYLYETEFARDFKSLSGMTPTAWRRAELSRPEPDAERAPEDDG